MKVMICNTPTISAGIVSYVPEWVCERYRNLETTLTALMLYLGCTDLKESGKCNITFFAETYPNMVMIIDVTESDSVRDAVALMYASPLPVIMESDGVILYNKGRISTSSGWKMDYKG